MADFFQSLVKHYKKEFPHLNLSVKRKHWKGDWADNWPAKEVFKNETVWWMCIWIQRSLSTEAQLFVLVHEVGHALTYWDDHHPSDHGPRFGEGYAAAWRSYKRWIAIKKRKPHYRIKMRKRKKCLSLIVTSKSQTASSP